MRLLTRSLIRHTASRRPAFLLALVLALCLPLQGYAAVTGCCHAAMAGDLSAQMPQMAMMGERPACHDMMLSDAASQAEDQHAAADQQQAAQPATPLAGCDHCAGCHFASSSMTPPAALFVAPVPAGRIDANPPLNHFSTPYSERPQRPPLVCVV